MPDEAELDQLRCAARSLASEERHAGTASTVPAFLLFEHNGPWGVQAWRDAPFPDGLGRRVESACRRARLRGLLVRRHRARPGLPAHPQVTIACCAADGGQAASTRLERAEDAERLPLGELVTELRAGRTPAGWRPVGSLFLVCTHGRHDACCAERGRPVARALAREAPEATWEVSHIGGDRFAANVVVLPTGLYYGRVPPGRARELVAAHEDNRLVPDLLRGRTSYSFPVQAAEIALRQRLGVDALDDATLLSAHSNGSRTATTWRAAGATHQLVVEVSDRVPQRRLTCRAAQASAPPAYHCTGPTPAD
ncbi:MAG: sucrase ferredoxin [Streptosporangiales bacterium]